MRKIPPPVPKSFYIIDGHAQIYRAYFAPFRDLTSPSGEPTRATFVFTQMLLNLVENRKPDYLAMVIDDASETALFRKEIWPAYKANRKARPDDFNPQEERILQIVRDAGVPIFVKPGFEADDVIATMAKKLEGQGFEIFLVSKDKDLRQILNVHTKMFDVQSNDEMDPAAMEKKLGYGPAQAIDVQTLMGDATDNVPGVPGVGEKTAVKLVKQYGSAEAVLDHLEELTPKLRENFENFREFLPRTRQLVTLKTDLEMQFDAEECRYAGLNNDLLRTHFKQLGFTNLLSRLGDGPSAPVAKVNAGLLPRFQENLFGDVGDGPPDVPTDEGPLAESAANCDYHLVATEEQFTDLLQKLSSQKRFAFDTETDDLGAMHRTLLE